MKIGIFTDTYYPEINGVANSAYQLKIELEKLGNTVYVFTASNPYADEKENHVFRVKSVPFLLLKERRMSFAITKKWFHIIEKLHLDLIHTQTEFTMGHLGRKAAQRFQLPHIHTYHTIYEDYTHYLKVPGNEKLRGLIRSFSRACCDRADEIIVPTEKVKNLLFTYGVGKPVLVQPTGINLKKFELVSWNKVEKLRKQYELKKEHHVLLSVGRLSKEKNLYQIIDFLEHIVQKDKKVRLLIVGDGPEKNNLMQSVNDKNLEEYVIFTGKVQWRDIQNYYALGDVFVCASTSETQGLTFAEALAAGKPLLVHKDECLKDLLQPGTNGYAFKCADEFRQHYSSLFHSEQYHEMGGAARESAIGYSSESFGKNIEHIYQDLIRHKRMWRMERGDIFGKMHSVAG